MYVIENQLWTWVACHRYYCDCGKEWKFRMKQNKRFVRRPCVVWIQSHGHSQCVVWCGDGWNKRKKESFLASVLPGSGPGTFLVITD